MGNKENKEHRPDGYIDENEMFLSPKEYSTLTESYRKYFKPIYFSPPAKVEVSESVIEVIQRLFIKHYGNEVNFQATKFTAEVVNELRHLLSNK